MPSRILVSLGEERKTKLDRLAERRGQSRSALIRTAVDKMIASDEEGGRIDEFRRALDAAAVVWKEHVNIGDAVEWQRRERAGWTRPWDHDYDEVRAEFPDLFDAEDDRERAHWKAIYAPRGDHGE